MKKTQKLYWKYVKIYQSHHDIQTAATLFFVVPDNVSAHGIFGGPRDHTRRRYDVTAARRVKHRACGLSALRVRTRRPRRRSPAIIAVASAGPEKQGTPDPASAPREFTRLLAVVARTSSGISAKHRSI